MSNPSSTSPPLGEAHAASAAYREGVVAAMTRAELPRVAGAAAGGPAVCALRFSCLGLGVSDVPRAEAFYSALGFARVADAPLHAAGGGAPVPVLRSAAGLELHLLPAAAPLPRGADDGAPPLNVLMDVPAAEKAPGHTHASWSVPSVPAANAFFEGLGVPLSGTRSTLALFVRDPDRTTLEFERNDGKDEAPAGGITSAMIGFGRPLDHVGVRVRPPYQRHVEWYANMLGFDREVHLYEPNEDAAKNMRPWVTRTAAGADINLILNCPTPAPAPESGGEGGEARLVTPDGGLLPGILYAGFAIAESADEALARLRAAGADAALDSDLPAGWERSLPPAANARLAGGPSIVVRDLCGSLIRLTTAAKAAAEA